MFAKSTKPAFSLYALLFAVILFATTIPARGSENDTSVVFVCEHGNVKSLIASSLFNKAAQERGLPYRSIARGLTPESSVPPKIAAALRLDNVDVANFKPEKLTSSALVGAERVIAIGVDLSGFQPTAPVETWEDVPPASIDYSASRDALLRHIDALLTELQAGKAGGGAP